MVVSLTQDTMETEISNVTSIGFSPTPLRGYDFPVPLRTLEIGDRFASFCDNTCIECEDEIWTGTVLWQSPGSVEIWWDGDKDPTRCQPELLVWRWDPEPQANNPEWVDYWFNWNPGTPSAISTEPLTLPPESEDTLTHGN